MQEENVLHEPGGVATAMQDIRLESIKNRPKRHGESDSGLRVIKLYTKMESDIYFFMDLFFQFFS